MPNSRDYAPIGSRWEHRKGGKYTIVAHALIEHDLTPVIVYKADGATDAWVRPPWEFLDGRFSPIGADSPTSGHNPEDTAE